MPKQITTEELCSVIGQDLFKKCLDKFSGRQYYFKKKVNSLQFKNQKEKQEFIYNAYMKSGLNFNEIADKIDLSPEYVRKVFYKINDYKMHSKQKNNYDKI